VIDTIAIRARFAALSPLLNERARRLFVASEARAAGRGGITAVSSATGVARSTINRGLAELRSTEPRHASRIRRPGGGRKPKIETEPGLLETLSTLVQSAIRGDPEAALLWVSKSQRHLAGAMAELGFTVGQKLVGRLLRRLGFSLQANSKTREGTNHPDRNAQFEYINARINAFQATGQPTISVDTKKKELVGGRWCTWLVEGEMTPAPGRYAMTRWERTDFGRPVASIRFRTATPVAASVCWAAKPRARSRGPISAL
jgi:transposase